jgi:ATP-dependent RNA helicase DHX36
MTNRLPPSLYVPPHQRLGSDYGFNPVPLSPVRYVSAYDDRVSEDRQPQEGTFHCADLDDWNKRFSMLLKDSLKQEVISREKKDRRDFDKLAALATTLGLYRYINHAAPFFLLSH